MAFQTVNIVEKTNGTGFPRDLTVSGNNNISKGIFVSLKDPRTASAVIVLNDVIGGLTNSDVTANTGQTNITVLTDFIADVVCSGTVTLGSAVGIVQDNYIKMIPETVSGAVIANLGIMNVGYALETGSDTERIEVRFRF
jgi:hypothetical protein